MSLSVLCGNVAVGSSARAVNSCPTPPQQNGVDVSSENGGSINFSQVAAAGITFVYARASDGTTFTDPDYTQNKSNAEAAGLDFGAYAVFEPSQDPTAQANAFLEEAAPTGAELIPMLDLEITPNGMSTSQYVSEISTWVDVVQAALRVKPLIYTSPYFWNTYTDNDTTFGSGRYPLWVAHWGVQCPTMPSGWSSFVMWQSSDSGSVSGISGPVDTDQFNAGANGGSLSAFTVSGARLSRPTITHLAPQAGPTAGGNTVTITGHAFAPGAGVKFGATASESVTVVSASEIKAVVPAHSGGTVPVSVETGGGLSRSSDADLYAYGTPRVTSLSPASGPKAGGNTVTIRGRGFVPGAAVKFGKARSKSVTFVSGTKLRARAPAHRTGRVRVRVSTPAGRSSARAEYDYR